MKKLLLALGALLLSASVWALPCSARDSWTGPDKMAHLTVGAGIGAAGVLAFNRPRDAFLLGVGVAAAKELYDRGKPNHQCSLQDFMVTAAGAYAGAYGSAFILGPGFIGYARRF